MAVVTLDGAVESQTAAVLEPYSGRGAADGLMKLSPQDLTKTVSTLDSHGWQVAVTANGDRAVRAALDAYEAAAAPRSRVAERRRHRIEGVELVDPDDVPRFEGLGVIASLQPAHARPDRLQVWSRNVGPERAALGWASHSLAGAGARLAFGSDWPNLPLDPVAGLNAAVNRSIARRTQEGETIEEERPADAVLYAGEALALKSAINAWTSSAAWASFDEHRKGHDQGRNARGPRRALCRHLCRHAGEARHRPKWMSRSSTARSSTSGIDAGTRPTKSGTLDARSTLHHQSHPPQGRDVGASDRRRRRPGPRAGPP